MLVVRVNTGPRCGYLLFEGLQVSRVRDEVVRNVPGQGHRTGEPRLYPKD